MRSTVRRCVRTMALAASLLVANVAAADQVLDWNHTVTEAFIAMRLPPPPVVRINALVHGAMYDAYAGISRQYHPFHVTERAAPGASRQAAIIQAAYTVAVALLPPQKARFDAQLAQSLAELDEGRSQDLGRAWGEYVANTWLAWRANDGWTAQYPPFTGGTAPGQWRPTPPGYQPMVFQQAAFMQPFAMTHPSQFRVPPPPPLTSIQYAEDYHEVRTYGRRTNSARTQDQTEVALFWNGASGVHWNEITRQVAQRTGTTLAENVRLFAIMNVAMMDEFISFSDGKRYYASIGYGWRPITAIELADTDSNPLTEPETGWSPLLVTPSHPEYPAGHPGINGIAAAVLTAFFGNEQSFTLEVWQLPGKPRSFTSFSQAHDEADDARIWSGLHLRSTNVATRQGAFALAHWIMENHFQPIHGGQQD